MSLAWTVRLDFVLGVDLVLVPVAVAGVLEWLVP